MRAKLLILFWFPSMTRVMWRMASGRLFIYRDESNDFLRFMLWYLPRGVPAEYEHTHNLIAHLDDEIDMRRRRGDWP